jgi:Leucine-rich repeat (LRR) protein
MMKLFVVSILIFLWSSLNAQNTSDKIYRLEEVLNANPDTIYVITLAKSKLTELPNELWKFRNLRELHLEKNRLNSLPDSLDLFKKLELLNLDRNDFETVPLVISRLVNLKKLIFSRNQINVISGNLFYCSKLEEMDFYDNPIGSVEPKIFEMKQLKKFDIQGVMLSTKTHSEVKTKLNWVQVSMDPPCKCLD